MKSMINWFTIPTQDWSRAVGFYSTIFDMEMIRSKDPEGRDLAFFLNPEEKAINGGIADNPNLKPGTDGVVMYFNADGKLDSILERVESAGGKVVMPKTGIDQWGHIAWIHDTEGNFVGLHSAS